MLEPRPARVDRFELIERPDAGHRRLRGRLGQGRLHAQPGPRPRRGLRHARPYRRAAPPAGRPVHRGPGDSAGQTAARRTIPRRASPDLLLPVATALADIPALALTEAEAGGLRHGQAISLVTLMGRIPGSADPDGGLVRAMAGGRVIGLGPAGRRLDEARADAVHLLPEGDHSDVDHRGAPHGADRRVRDRRRRIPAARKCRSPCSPSASAT